MQMPSDDARNLVSNESSERARDHSLATNPQFADPRIPAPFLAKKPPQAIKPCFLAHGKGTNCGKLRRINNTVRQKEHDDETM